MVWHPSEALLICYGASLEGNSEKQGLVYASEKMPLMKLFGITVMFQKTTNELGFNKNVFARLSQHEGEMKFSVQQF
jgi:hypothetical protein